ncbi:MAG: DUF1553 domain-containing protein, partial [Planctomycetaceae bacterium]|nr:DUF1553 domain-containing protein [Planctomycetaceae bacterium]
MDFGTEIIPLLTKHGCNSGACHGAAAGRGEFRLSLFGSHPQKDYRSMVHDLKSRRINLSIPERSLLWKKATESVSHEGGQRFEPDSPASKRLIQWIRQGAPGPGHQRLLEFQVRLIAEQNPDDAPNAQPSEGQQTRCGRIECIAKYNDGQTENVGDWTVLTPEDAATCRIGSDGSVSVSIPGRHLVTARFLNRVVPIEIIVPYSRGGLVAPENEAQTSRIDHFVNLRLEEMGLAAAGQCSDLQFLRRASLDLTGTLPDDDDIRWFQDQAGESRREVLVDRLMQDPRFVDLWTLRLSEILRVTQIHDDAAVECMISWIKGSLRDHTGFDGMIREMLLAEGPPAEYGPAGFYLVGSDARTQAEYVAEALMGARLRCANCHDHPLDRWTQDDYHGLAAVFAGVERGSTIRYTDHGTVIHPGTGQPAVPRTPGHQFLAAAQDYRRALADWMTSPANRIVPRAMVNRLWRLLMGRGLVEPVDDFRETNLASHPALLEYLTDEFVASGYDIQHVIRLIVMSQAYSRSCQPVDSQPVNDLFYSQALIRPLHPAVLLDAINDVAGRVPETGDGGSRQIAMANPAMESDELDV